MIPFYTDFLVIMAFAGLGVTRRLRLDAPAGRATVFGEVLVVVAVEGGFCDL